MSPRQATPANARLLYWGIHHRRAHARKRTRQARTNAARKRMHVRAHAVRRVACFAHLELSDVQIAAERAAAALVPEWAFHIRV
jgi:hypothetical protein